MVERLPNMDNILGSIPRAIETKSPLRKPAEHMQTCYQRGPAGVLNKHAEGLGVTCLRGTQAELWALPCHVYPSADKMRNQATSSLLAGVL